MRIDRPGIYPGLPMADYIADPCPAPSLTKGTVKTIIERSPLHAHMAHPRLGGVDRGSSNEADIGSAIHGYTLGGDEAIIVVGADSYRTKDARALRDEAYEQGRVPILERDHAQVIAASHVAKLALQDLLGDGYTTEETLVWQTQGVWCRGRTDAMNAQRNVVVDLKTTTNADPASWVKRSLFSGGYDVQDAFYQLGLEELVDRSPREFLFLLIEKEPPYGYSVVGLHPAALEVARRKVTVGLHRWRRCMEKNEWPGYSKMIHWAEMPTYEEWGFEARLAVGEAS